MGTELTHTRQTHLVSHKRKRFEVAVTRGYDVGVCKTRGLGFLTEVTPLPFKSVESHESTGGCVNAACVHVRAREYMLADALKVNTVNSSTKCCSLVVSSPVPVSFADEVSLFFFLA